jgi:hypothetical protein
MSRSRVSGMRGPRPAPGVRHTIPEITERMDPVAAFDVSVPRSALTALRAELAGRLARA